MILALARRDVATAAPDDGVRDLAAQMEYYNVGCIVITDGQRPVGIVTDRDLALRALGPGRDPATLRAKDIMTRSVRVVREDEGLDRALQILESAGIRRLPVVDAKRRLRGLITLDDLVDAPLRHLDAIAGLLRQQRRIPRSKPVARKREPAGLYL